MSILKATPVRIGLAREKRRAPRAKHDSVLELHDEKGRFVASVGRLVNFSNVGACFASTQVLKQGQRIHARLRLLKEGRLYISGHVVWVKRKANVNHYGMEFDAIRRTQA